jgi:hypothetical protein
MFSVLLVLSVICGAATAQSGKAGAAAAGVVQYWQQQILANNLPVADPANWGMRNLARFTQLGAERLALVQKAGSLAEVEQLIQSAPMPDGASLDLLLATQPGVTMMTTGTDQGNSPSTRLALKSDPTSSPTSYADLVFTALTPCRIYDSRPTQGGLGIWAAGSVNTVKIGPYPGGYAFQGGSATDCGLSALASSGQIAAIMASVSSFNQGGSGFLTFYSNGAPNPAPYGVSQSYSPASGILTSFVVMPTDLAGPVYSSGYTSQSTNVTIDVVGYFAAPHAAALDCSWTADGTASAPATGAMTIATSPTCATGYTLTGGSCYGGTAANGNYLQNSRYGANAWICEYSNLTAGALTIRSAARCCRTPGR